MLDQLMQLIQQNGQQSIVNNPDVPNEHNEAVMQEAGNTIFSGLQNMISAGGTDQLQQMFQNGQTPDANHPAVQQISGNFAQNIMQKFGINGQAATQLASSLIPSILGKMSQQGQSTPGSGFNFSNILQSLQGGGIQNTINSVGKSFGLDKDGDGDVDLDDLKKMF